MAERESAPQTPEWLTTAAGIVGGGGGGGTRGVLRELSSNTNSTPMRELKAQMARMQQEVAKARTEAAAANQEAAAANQRNQVLEAFAGIAKTGHVIDSATRIASSLRRRLRGQPAFACRPPAAACAHVSCCASGARVPSRLRPRRAAGWVSPPTHGRGARQSCSRRRAGAGRRGASCAAPAQQASACRRYSGPVRCSGSSCCSAARPLFSRGR